MENIPLVPFGKYKGKPVTEFLADKNYVSWAKQQGLFEKFTINNINIVQQSSNQDSPTPEHNKFQNLFLEECFRSTFVDKYIEFKKQFEKLYENQDFIKYFGESKFNITTSVVFETLHTNWDVLLSASFSDIKSDETEVYKIFRQEQDLIHDQKIHDFEIEKSRRDTIYEEYLVKFQEGIDGVMRKWKKNIMSLHRFECNDKKCNKNHQNFHDVHLCYDVYQTFSNQNKYRQPREKPLENGHELKSYDHDKMFVSCYSWIDDFESKHTNYLKNYEKTINEIFYKNRKIFYKNMFGSLTGIKCYDIGDNFYDSQSYDCTSYTISINSFSIACELKPTIGDEYPCILRKFKEQRDKTRKSKQHDATYYILAFKNLTAETVSYVQLQEIFKQSDIPILMINEDEESMRSRLARLENEKLGLIQKLSTLCN